MPIITSITAASAHEHQRSHTRNSSHPITPTLPASAAAPPPPPPPLAPSVIRAADLQHLSIPRRRQLMDRWLCAGDLGYIFAPRGVGKTWLAMALPIAISLRQPLGLWQAAESDSESLSSSSSYSSSPSESGSEPSTSPTPPALPLPILYVDGEMPLELTQFRARALGLAPSGVDILHHEQLFQDTGGSLNIGDEADRARITNLLIEHGYQLLVLDNLSSLASGVDENKGTDYEPVSHWLLELRRRQITVIVVHHAGRNGLMRGHSKREDACSWILDLKDAKKEDEPGAKFVTHFAKPSRNTGTPMPDLQWHFTTDTHGQAHIHCETAAVTDYEQFIQHVCDGVSSQGDLAEMMGKNRGTVSKWAKRALQDGLLTGSPNKLLPPKNHDNTHKPAKTRVHASDDDSLAEFSADDTDGSTTQAS